MMLRFPIFVIKNTQKKSYIWVNDLNGTLTVEVYHPQSARQFITARQAFQFMEMFNLTRENWKIVCRPPRKWIEEMGENG
jgi:hypothetical protein